jgi:hypothetical protein
VNCLNGGNYGDGWRGSWENLAAEAEGGDGDCGDDWENPTALELI